MIDTLLILGGHIQALGLARQAYLKGLKIVLVIPDKYSVARFSKAVDEVCVCKSEDDLINYLEKHKRKNTMLFPTNDEYISFIVKHKEKLKDFYTIALPEYPIVQLFADKSETYRFAENNNIPHPWCKYPQSLSETQTMADGLDYPVVIKPTVMYDFHKKFGKKAFLCKDKQSLLEKIKELESNDYPISSIIIQEYLSGGAKNLYSFGFFAVDGEVKSSITVNRIRQNPMDFGNSTTYAITSDVQEIQDIATSIVKQTRYTGMGEVEFMFDKGKYKFLETNTRAWKWHTITDGRNFSFIGDWIDWLNQGCLSERRDSKIQCAWVERFTDMAVIIKGIFRGYIKLGGVIKSYQQRKISAVWNIKDPLPAIMYILMSPILYVKRY